MTPARWRARRRLRATWQREQDNGLRDDSWVPVLVVDGRIVADLLRELRRAGVPARCARFRNGQPLFPPRGACGWAEAYLAGPRNGWPRCCRCWPRRCVTVRHERNP